MTDNEETVEIPRSLAEELADHHKTFGRHAYSSNRTTVGDLHHGWARRLNDSTGRDWQEVADE